MSQQRIQKFKRILRFQEQQAGVIRQQLSAVQQEIDILGHRHEQFLHQITLVENRFASSTQNLSLLESGNNAIRDLHHQKQQLEIEMVAAGEKLNELRRQYLEREQEIQSWEKLIDKESETLAAAHLKLEMRQADERYLTTQFTGEQR